MTAFADPIFPLPDPGFLWVYNLVVHDQGASVTVGSGRKWRWSNVSGASVMGYVAAPDRREVDRAASRGVRLDAVALVPHGTAVEEADELEVATTSGAPPTLWGRYEIQAVRPNPSHVRLLLVRIAGEAVPAHGG